MRALVVLLLVGTAIAQAPGGNLKQVMRSVLLPNSNIIFEFQSITPKNDMQWQTVAKAAIAIQESANLILLPGRLRSNGQPAPVQAADYDISNCTDLLSEACDNCHKIYRDPLQR
jgi:hypothetical protein